MALSINNRGTGTHNTGASSFTLSPGSNFAAGDTAVLCVAADNSSSGGATNDFTTVTDSLGNTWTKRQSPVFDNGAASAGVQGAIFDCYQNVGTLQTSTVITVNFGSSPVAKTWTLTGVTPAAGKQAKFRTGGDKAAGATGTAATSGASATISVGEVSVFAIFIEAGTTQTCTGDGDTTNGTWSALQYAEIGSTTSGSCIASQAKLQTTANSTQTHDVTLGISSDYHSSYAVYVEITAYALTCSSGSFTETGTAATLKYGRLASAGSGSFPLTGTDATTKRGYLVLAGAGSFVETGSDATLTYTPGGGGYTLTAGAGSVSLTGIAAGLLVARLLGATGATFAETGAAATVKAGRVAIATTGSFMLSGTAASLRRGYVTIGATNSYALSGTAATLSRTRLLVMGTGALSATGQDVTLTGPGGAGGSDYDSHEWHCADQRKRRMLRTRRMRRR